MGTSNAGPVAAGETIRREENLIATTIAIKKKRILLRKIMVATPFLVYLLILYLLIELLVVDVRHVLFSVAGYSLTWVEVLYLVAMGTAMVELLKVSVPGVDNTDQVLWMLSVGIGYLVFFVLGAAGVSKFSIFTKTEFLFLVLVAAIQIAMAFKLNARTLKRTTDISNLN